MTKTEIRKSIGAPAVDRYLQHEEVKPKQWRDIWKATAPQAKGKRC